MYVEKDDEIEVERATTNKKQHFQNKNLLKLTTIIMLAQNYIQLVGGGKKVYIYTFVTFLLL